MTPWLDRNAWPIRIVSVAVVCLSLGFTIGIRVGKSFGDRAAARSDIMTKTATKTTENCLDTLKRVVAHAPTGKPSADAAKGD